jgi:hypothetical protein
VETSTFQGIEYLSSDATKIIVWRCDQLTKPQQVALKIASVFGRDFVLGDLRRALQTLDNKDIAANLFSILTDIVDNSALLRWKSINNRALGGLSPATASPAAPPPPPPAAPAPADLATSPLSPASTASTNGSTTPTSSGGGGGGAVEDPTDKLQFEFADQVHIY